MMEDSSSERKRSCLSEVVSDCVRRWFQETLKEAKAGDLNMQILVAQMYYSGYGVPVDAQKVPFSAPFYFCFMYVFCSCICNWVALDHFFVLLGRFDFSFYIGFGMELV